MDTYRKSTSPNPALSLVPLASALIAAEQITPSRVPRPDLDPNEALAAQLIERIKHPRLAAFPGLRIEPPSPFLPISTLEMAGRDV